ncbi:Hint domain-containing protein [Jannaschia donghaensis]|uniref:Hint domain-containing protein n=1 Tax=Jannaschia donghaensis TaxID=420998 RepID=UPI0006D7D3AC|nr:Hint domain-containing protein [Jannaschia donghaensis]
MDGDFPSARTPYSVNASFRWFGTPIRLDGARAALLLDGAKGQAELRANAPKTIAKLTRGRGSSAVPLTLTDSAEDPEALIVSDGQTRWAARLVPVGHSEALLVFDDGLPPPNKDLRIVQSPSSPADPASQKKTLCFTAGTMIDTPEGPRPVEDLYPGDRVTTRDNGPQDIVWVGLRRVSGARMFAMPALRPVRIRAGTFGTHGDLTLSPGHQILLSGDAPRALWNTPEVLVRAQHLIDDRRVTVDHGATDAHYLHILTARHEVLRANGMWCESFHPGEADLTHIDPGDLEDLLDRVPGIDIDDTAYGPHARRCLSAAELAIQMHAGAPRYLRP